MEFWLVASYIMLGTNGLSLAVFFYLLLRVEARRPRRALSTTAIEPGRPVMLCLGDSITVGNLGGDWVGPLSDQLSPEGPQVINAGMNGAVVLNVIEKLERALATEPDLAVLMVGTNDVMAAERPERARLYVHRGRLKQVPTFAASLQQLQTLVAELARRVPRVALCTIPPLGDDPSHPVSTLVDRYNREVRQLAAAHGCELLDVHAEILSLLPDRGRPYVGPLFKAMCAMLWASASRFILGRSWDAISRRAGFGATVDGVHMSDVAAARIGALVASFAEAAPQRSLEQEAPPARAAGE